MNFNSSLDRRCKNRVDFVNLEVASHILISSKSLDNGTNFNCWAASISSYLQDRLQQAVVVPQIWCVRLFRLSNSVFKLVGC